MAALFNVVLRKATYHFRRGVPLDLRPQLRRRELVRSLATSDARTAKLRACRLPEENSTPWKQRRTSAAPKPPPGPTQTCAAAPEKATGPCCAASVTDDPQIESTTVGDGDLDRAISGEAGDKTGTIPNPITNSLTEIIEELIRHKGTTWDRKTRRQHRSVSKMLSEIAGTDDLREINHAHLVAYAQNLSNLPKSYGKNSRDTELSIAKLFERGEIMLTSGQPEKVGLSPATVNRHITQLSTIAKYWRAKQRPIGQVELLSDFRLVDPERDGEKRPAFEVDEIERLFKHPVWTSTASETDMLQIASQQQIFAAVYWLPLLGYYTCARLSELAYLEVGDVDVERSSLQTRLTGRRRLKNAVSRRTLPIHPELTRLGFLDFVRVKSGERNDLIFFPKLHSLVRTPRYRTFSTSAGPSSWMKLCLRRARKERHFILSGTSATRK